MSNVIWFDGNVVWLDDEDEGFDIEVEYFPENSNAEQSLGPQIKLSDRISAMNEEVEDE